MNDAIQRDGNIIATAPQTQPVQTSARTAHPLLIGLTWTLVLLAFATSALLLFADFAVSLLPGLSHAPISAAPLLLIGSGSLVFQALRRPGLLDLFKALIVSLAFLLWGIDQLLPAGWEATVLGDSVIILYVIDLGWMIADALRAKKPEAVSSEQ